MKKLLLSALLFCTPLLLGWGETALALTIRGDVAECIYKDSAGDGKI